MMIEIRKLSGTDKKLYPLVGPLVMNPQVLKYNHNYAFKTGKAYQWYIAAKGKKIVGFVPVENKPGGCILNNYYAQKEDHDEIIRELLKTICEDEDYKGMTLNAIVQSPHAELFARQGFTVYKEWTLYLKMQKTNGTETTVN